MLRASKSAALRWLAGRYSLGLDSPTWLVHSLVMRAVNVHEAKTHLSRLLSRVARGEEVVIQRAGKPVARLVPIARPTARRTLGRDRGKVFIADDFDAPLAEDVLLARAK